MKRGLKGDASLTAEHLLGQLWNSQCTILLRTTGGQWCKASHEEVQTWEWHKVHCNLAQVAVQLSWETQAASHAAHSCRHQMVQVTICWRGQLQSAEADVVQCFVVQQERLIRVLHQLMETQDCLGLFSMQGCSKQSCYASRSSRKQKVRNHFCVDTLGTWRKA